MRFPHSYNIHHVGSHGYVNAEHSNLLMLLAGSLYAYVNFDSTRTRTCLTSSYVYMNLDSHISSCSYVYVCLNISIAGNSVFTLPHFTSVRSCVNVDVVHMFM